MSKLFLLALSLSGLFCCSRQVVKERTAYFPRQLLPAVSVIAPENLWVFIMAGQSNMAGRGQVEAGDTLSHPRIRTVDSTGRLIYAKEPLHFYEYNLKGLDCGMAFARALLKRLPDSIHLLILPAAVGGSSVSQWLGDSLHRNVKLYSNFREKIALASKAGSLKGILWHQGESDASEINIPLYRDRLAILFKKFREDAGIEKLPILIGELGAFPKYQPGFGKINEQIHLYSAADPFTTVIPAQDLKHKGDSLHFNAASQRVLGKRFAKAFISKFYDP